MAISYAIPESPLSSLEYNPSQPTRQTEELSMYLHYIINDLAANGAKIYIETATPEEMVSAADSYQSEFSAWSRGVVESVGSYLSEPDESRSLPMLPLAPMLPVTLASAIMLPPALLLKTGVDIVGQVMHSYNETRALARQYDLNRVLDKSLNSKSFWGAGRPYLAEIRDILDAAVNADNSDELGVIRALRSIVDNSGAEAIIKVLTHIVLDRGNSIEDVETYFPEMRVP